MVSGEIGASGSDLIYLDNNGTTPLAPEVAHAISVAAVNAFGNPSSSSILGRAANKLIIESRAEIAQMVNCDPFDIVFTSGGTEANNWVIFAAMRYYNERRKGESLPHFVISSVEHDAVSEPISRMVSEGRAEVSKVPINSSGSIHVEDVVRAIKKETALVSIMLANNETGAIFPVGEIMRAVHAKARDLGTHVLCHTDAAQCFGKMKVDVKQLNVDYLTIVGHKFYGPRIGALFVNSPGTKTPLPPIFFGGGQERGFRSGTENTPMIVGLGAAAKLINQNLDSYVVQMKETKAYFIEKLKEVFPEDSLHFNHPDVQNSEKCLVNTISVGFFKPGWRLFTGSAILNNMSGVIASVGAACHSSGPTQSGAGSGAGAGAGPIKPSNVLIASNVQFEIAIRTLRISLGRQTTLQDVDAAVKQIYNAVCISAQTKI